jgi:flagellar motor switch protein FliG
MSNEKSIVITAYGHNRTIDKIAVCSFDDYHHHDGKLNAEIYCNTINSLELKGDDWVFAKIVSENTQYPADVLFPLRFDIITTLHDRAIQKVLREVDAQVIAIALKGESEALKETIFKNMSKRAAEMLKEDMEFMGPLRLSDVKESQKRILDIIRHLEQTGEIVISYSTGEIVE